MRPGPHELTVRQAEVLSFIRDHIAAKGYPPIDREITAHFGWGHTGAHDHLRALIRKDCLVRVGAGSGRGNSPSRTLRLVTPAEGPARVDLSSGVVASDNQGTGVAYRVTGAYVEEPLREITLSPEGAKTVEAMMDAPGVPNERLSAAMAALNASDTPKENP